MAATRRRVAVVGSGVAGLTAAYVASRSADVTLFEADARLGGHADTHDVTDPTGRALRIDSGFIVHNRRTYPVLLRLFHELNIPTQESEMSMSISDEGSRLEWAGALGRQGVFPRGERHHRNPRYLRMLADIPRFHRRAKKLLEASDTTVAATRARDLTTLREFLDDGRFSPYFRRHFMEPLVAAVWSCDPDTALDYPAAYLFAFLQHHGMLSVFGSPTWRTVSGGSHTYVNAVAEALKASGATIHLASPVSSVREGADGVEIVADGVGAQTFDAVVIAAHPEQALAMLAEPTPLQSELLAAIPYSPNVALLHTDTRLMPRNHDTWASWNFRRPAAAQDGVLVTYDLTRLQRLTTSTHYLVTLGGEHLVDPATVIVRREYAHPLYTPASVAAQARLPEIDTDRVAFAGAYHGWGFHEDGARSGLRAAERLGLTWDDDVPPDPRTPTAEGGSAVGVRGLASAQEAGENLNPRSAAGVADSGDSGDSAGEVLGVHHGDAVTAFRTTLTHVRREPLTNRFEHRSHFWAVDLGQVRDDGTVRGGRGRWLGRDHFTGEHATIRAGLDAYLAGQGIDLRGGRAVTAAQPRVLGHCFNPISVHWVWADPTGRGRPDATVVEVHNTYGDRHTYLLDADDAGRARIDKAMYVSPFHGVDGHYEVVAPPPDPHTGRLRLAVRLVTDDGARFDASLTGVPAAAPPLALAGLRGSALIRAHGISLWLRRLPIQPRPVHPRAALPHGGKLQEGSTR